MAIGAGVRQVMGGTGNYAGRMCVLLRSGVWWPQFGSGLCCLSSPTLQHAVSHCLRHGRQMRTLSSITLKQVPLPPQGRRGTSEWHLKRRGLPSP